MSGIFSKKLPKPEKVPVPRRSEEATQQAAIEERRKLQAGAGTSWLTGGLGVARSSFQSAGAKLLSGGAA